MYLPLLFPGNTRRTRLFTAGGLLRQATSIAALLSRYYQELSTSDQDPRIGQGLNGRAGQVSAIIQKVQKTIGSA